MIDPNKAFLEQRAPSTKDKITRALIDKFFCDNPGEVFGIAGMTEDDLKNSSLVSGWKTKKSAGAFDRDRHYVRFLNGLVYAYQETMIAMTGRSKVELGMLFIRARTKES